MPRKPQFSGEDGFSAQDDMAPDISVVTAAEMARLDDLERRWAAVGCDIFGSPLPGEGAS